MKDQHLCKRKEPMTILKKELGRVNIKRALSATTALDSTETAKRRLILKPKWVKLVFKSSDCSRRCQTTWELWEHMANRGFFVRVTFGAIRSYPRQTLNKRRGFKEKNELRSGNIGLKSAKFVVGSDSIVTLSHLKGQHSSLGLRSSKLQKRRSITPSADRVMFV